ncbi:MAG: hypothetical protein M3389_07255 [Actinomycetota bacterium]|nr:hypothetical protein [Actinomycetota bacterium]
MREIPFVDRLGDALDEAIARDATPARRRRRSPRWRLGVIAVGLFMLGAGGVTLAEILDDPEKLAAHPIACYDEASLDANVYVQSADGQDPVDKCAEVLRSRGALVACVRGDTVAVFPGPAQMCDRLGLKPLPRGYAAATEKLERLRRDVTALARGEECVPPHVLARRIQRMLDRSGWRGWRAVVEQGQGPCGTVGPPVTVRADRPEVLILPGPPRSLDELLSREAVAFVFGSGDRCFTVAELKARARRVLAPARRPILFAVERAPMPEYEHLEPPARQQRFDEGCAVAGDVYAVYPSPNTTAIRVEIRVKD